MCVHCSNSSETRDQILADIPQAKGKGLENSRKVNDVAVSALKTLFLTVVIAGPTAAILAKTITSTEYSYPRIRDKALVGFVCLGMAVNSYKAIRDVQGRVWK